MEKLINKYPNDQELGKVVRDKINNNEIALVGKLDLINVLFYIKHNTILDMSEKSLSQSNNGYHKAIHRVLQELNVKI